MISMIRKPIVLACLAIGFVGTSARADLELQITVDNTTANVTMSQTFAGASGTEASTGGNFVLNGVTINGDTTSDSPGEGTSNYLLGSTLKLSSNGSAAYTVTISVGDTGFTSPITPPSITATSSLSGNTTLGGANAGNSITAQSWINTNNGQNGTTGPTTTGMQSTYSTVNQITTKGSSWALNDGSATITTLSPTYSMTTVATVQLATGHASNVGFGSQLSLQSNENTQSVPEPSTMALAGIGALGLIGYGLRRRKVPGA